MPTDVVGAALSAFMKFCDLSGLKLKDSKAENGPSLTFLGALGEFPGPHSEMTMTISAPRGESIRWDLKLQEFILNGAIEHKEIGSSIGGLSPTQTSIYGRVGRAMLTSLFQKLNAKYYTKILSGRESAPPRWWAVALLNITPRLGGRPKHLY